nr:extensin-like [Penaeus vannamei]
MDVKDNCEGKNTSTLTTPSLSSTTPPSHDHNHTLNLIHAFNHTLNLNHAPTTPITTPPTSTPPTNHIHAHQPRPPTSTTPLVTPITTPPTSTTPPTFNLNPRPPTPTIPTPTNLNPRPPATPAHHAHLRRRWSRHREAAAPPC